uniref:DNA-directed RNA polymerase subunit n=1 Tax=Clastoptera arizonana TaxID=38151 RepID=A0A1B6D164_9HEMI
MASNFDMFNSKFIFNKMSPDLLQFGLFSSDEIKNLSVVKICTPLTFNALGHPLAGGLYDPALGPIDKKFSNTICSTCYNNVFKCPGHIGHIELPVPVVNPLFHKVVYSILRLSCLHCYYILIPPLKKYTLIGQLRLLESGYLTEALEVENFLQERFNSIKVDDPHNESISIMYLEIIENHVSSIINTVSHPSDQCKSVEVFRNKFISEAMKEMYKSKTCPSCKHSIRKVVRIQNKLMRLAKVEVASKFKDRSAKLIDSSPTAVKEGQYTYVLPTEAMKFLRQIWNRNTVLINEIAPVLKTSTTKFPTDLFFFTILPVTPTNTRPVMVQNNLVVEHPQNSVYKSILNDCVIILSIVHIINENESDVLTSERKQLLLSLRGSSYHEKLQFVWQNLQMHCDMLMDKDVNKLERSNGQGIKQIIEKKEGIIRMHMMGKRVNFAARSVITPDPNLNIDEIGIPDAFAMKLTYPVPVTAWNVTELRKMVINGPNIHPGAVMIKNEDGSISKIPADNKLLRESIAKRLLTPGEKNKGVKIIYRHLLNGDILLLNRQPTLHKPSIMAHKARILKGEKTLRLHYANCKAYNADFDGDEMNAHFPQNEIARSEAYNLVNVCKQYLVPKDGTPLSGLIQDHMVSGVRLSMRGKFFNKEDYMQLVFQALGFKQGDIVCLPPSILKPARLWSGKQIISTVIINIIPKDKVPLNLKSSSKISYKAWEKQNVKSHETTGYSLQDPKLMTEAEVIIRNGELLCGVLDKTHYGSTPYSLVHCFYELYGGQSSTQLLSSLAKLFTSFLQIEGFTLGVEDILVVESADADRLKFLKEARQIGKEAVTRALDLSIETPLIDIQKKNGKFL